MTERRLTSDAMLALRIAGLAVTEVGIANTSGLRHYLRVSRPGRAQVVLGRLDIVGGHVDGAKLDELVGMGAGGLQSGMTG